MNEILILLKALTNTTESDASLSKLVVTAALIAQREMEFSPVYTIDIANSTITPNPVDNAFILIVAYKASLLLLQTEIRSGASNSIKIVDGPSTIDLTNRTIDLRGLLSSLLLDYSLIKRDYLYSGSLGQCVITPTTVGYISRSNFS